MDDLWLVKATLVGCMVCALIGGIIGWLTFGEIDPEV